MTEFTNQAAAGEGFFKNTHPEKKDVTAVGLLSTWPRRLLAWLLLAVFLAAIFQLTDSIDRRPFMPIYLLLLGKICAALWLVAVPFVSRLAKAIPLAPRLRLSHLAAHVPISVTIALLCTLAFALLMWGVNKLWLDVDQPFISAFRASSNYFLLSNILYYWLLISTHVAFEYANEFRSAHLRAAKVENQLAQARLDVLRMQMRPHFLFNTLNSVSALIRINESEKALGVVSRLGAVLRDSLDQDVEAFATLEDEIHALEEYLGIERVRFGDRLVFSVKVGDDTLQSVIPRWVLQPLVENAILHGIESSPNGGRIELRARRDGDRLVMEVEDDGKGMSPSSEDGIGLGNTRRRLQELYSNHHEIRVDSQATGTTVVVSIPFEESRGQLEP